MFEDEKVTDLKTLKDLIEPCCGRIEGCGGDEHTAIEPDKLRAEAIKWVKEINKQLDGNKEVDGTIMVDINGNWLNHTDNESFEPEQVRDFIMYFFNLKEEDLK